MLIKGFKYSAVAAGIRKKDRLDLGLIFSEEPCAAAGVFTTSRVKAAPVLLDMERIRQGRAQAILVNSGVANACTGKLGLQAAQTCSGVTAAALNIDENLVQVASTGVIGEQLPVEKIVSALDKLVFGLSSTGYDEVARAIMTTDTAPKIADRTCMIDNSEIKLFGMAKGAGMIMPDMATMLCFVMTDADIAADILQLHLATAVKFSFNRITVDGDTSTNDTVLVLANRTAGNPEIIDPDSEAGRTFAAALADLLKDLALQIVADGEGATKTVTVRVINAATEKDAELAARTIANSPLVKTAFFGEDANWGRIIAALGRSGIEFDQNRVDIFFDEIQLVQDGLARGLEAEAGATEVLKQKAFAVTVDLKNGKAAAEILTCDLSLDYIKINADYRS
ncbi:MAG: bifunctional glutamate N-acetyltransferase/amino-acid acetyltransferase ArgJ [Deltaproteobacteria bacterium]|nr:bifunctional glutamate N-acetyltransferase/amino-acid acetyltransferase ArgJ [Deltaproteobacteria bacterium]